MKRQISLHNRVVNYSVRMSTRAKRMRLAVYSDGNLVVTVPQAFPTVSIDKYITEKSQWVISKLDFFEAQNKKQKISFSEDGYDLYKDKALEIVAERLTSLNETHYRFIYNKIAIKDQKTRWGSCSRKKNLNFNYKILFLSPRMKDYIIVHELCHLKEFNHSNKFWKLVATSLPDYHKIVEELKMKGLTIS